MYHKCDSILVLGRDSKCYCAQLLPLCLSIIFHGFEEKTFPHLFHPSGFCNFNFCVISGLYQFLLVGISGPEHNHPENINVAVGCWTDLLDLDFSHHSSAVCHKSADFMFKFWQIIHLLFFLYKFLQGA